MPVDASLLAHFASLEAPRRAAMIEHRLLDIVTIALCAVVRGAVSWT